MWMHCRPPAARCSGSQPKPNATQREDAIKIAEHYPHGLQAGSFVTVDAPFTDDAYRFENGRLMAGPGLHVLAGLRSHQAAKDPEASGAYV